MDEPTCGTGLAHGAAVPSGLAATAAGLAANLEIHVRALDPGDAAAAREREVYEGVTASLREAVAALRAAAERMRAAADLPMGAHDLDVLGTPEALDAFAASVAAEEELRVLLDGRRADNAEMLAAWRAESGA